MPAAGSAADVDNDGESMDHLREAGPSGASSLLQQEQPNAPPLYQQLSHGCEGACCLCQRYENGELAAAVLNLQGRNVDAEGYQNVPQRGHRLRAQNHAQNQSNLLNPNYQNPLDLIQQPNSENQPAPRRPERRHHEPEENIYERLDEVQGRGEPDHTYERIDDHRAWYRRARYRAAGLQNEAHVESRRLTGPSCLLRLGRNCFSTENIASATMSNRRYVYQFGNGCSCQFCRHADARPVICRYCHNFHDRLPECQESGGSVSGFGNSRHYIYQLSRNCRCPLCRDDSLYARFPVNSDSFRRECHCRNPGSCSCRSRSLSYSNPAIYIGRINHAVHNPLYADSGGAEASGSSRPGSSCQGIQNANRQHVCDDSCIRNPSVNGVYQVLGRCERAECHHGRISIHWVFVNKWLPSWGAQDSVPEADADADPEPPIGREESRERQNSDAEES